MAIRSSAVAYSISLPKKEPKDNFEYFSEGGVAVRPILIDAKGKDFSTEVASLPLANS